jgi:leader peptidase (prepilin peptidase)/N-methyltransferase
MMPMLPLLGLPILGLLAGCVINYLADVLPAAGSMAQPDCWNCGSPLPWNRYLLFRRCGVCGKWRRPRALIVEFALAAALLYLWLVPAHKLEFPLAGLLFAYLLLITVIDVEHRLILHITSIAGLVLGLGIGIHLHGLGVTLAGGAAGFGIMLAFYLLGLLFIKYVSRRRGEAVNEVALGYGDVNLAGIAGLLLGWPGIVFGLLFTVLAGGLASIVVIVVMLARRRYHAFSAIPYGPFLVLSILVLLLRP